MSRLEELIAEHCLEGVEYKTLGEIAIEAAGIVLLKSYEDYYDGCVDDKGREQKGYEEGVAGLLAQFPLGQPIIGKQNKKDFIVLFGNIFRLRNILSAFDRFPEMKSCPRTQSCELS